MSPSSLSRAQCLSEPTKKRPAFDSTTVSGRLARPCIRIFFRTPETYDQDVAAKGIHATREAVAKYGSYRKIPPEAVDARMAWKAVLGHNRLDCRTAREVVSRAAKEYAEAGASGQWAPSTARDRE